MARATHRLSRLEELDRIIAKALQTIADAEAEHDILVAAVAREGKYAHLHDTVRCSWLRANLDQPFFVEKGATD